MRAALWMTVSVPCFLAPGATALAEEGKCPVAQGGATFLDEVAKAVEAAPSCGRAEAIATACALGASGDNAIVAPAIAKCEAVFKAKLKKRQRRAYSKKRKGCAKRYAKKEGTLYISMAAFCRLGVAKKFVERYGEKK